MAETCRKGGAVTVDGIEVRVAVDLADDWDLLELNMANADPATTPVERTRNTVAIYRLVLGDDYGRVTGELRERGGGRLRTSEMQAFMAKVFAGSAALKNSDASDAS